MGKNIPKVSIIMGAYNCEITIKESIESIIDQTFEDWELIICDDASIDSTYELINSFKKQLGSKLVILKNDENKGLNFTLNKCLKVAKGNYIARMDADDISLPSRLEKEVNVLEYNKKFSIVSSEMIYFDEEGEWGISSMKEYPEKEDLIYGTPFCHAPCMVKREAYEGVGGYSENSLLMRVEDYHLWFKMYKNGYKGVNIKEPLYKMRDDKVAYKRRKFKYRINEAYVKWLILSNFRLSLKNYICILKPLIVGLMPKRIYDYLHKLKLNNNNL